LRLLGISMLPLSLSTVLNGYFIARRKASYNAFLQVFEMTARISFITLLLHFMLPRGLESGCMARVLGGVLAEIGSFAFFFALFVVQKGKEKRKKQKANAAVLKDLASVAMPIAASAYVRSGLLTLEHALIPVKIEQSGRSRKEAVADYGVLQGMALPIVLYPTAILYAVSGLLIPEFAERGSMGRHDAVRSLCRTVLRFTAMFGFGCALVMAVFGEQLGTLIYRSSVAGQYVWALAPLLPVMFLDHMTDAMLKGLGEQVWTMWVNIADAVISVVLVILLLPVFGAKGYILVIILAEILNFSLSFGRLLWKVKVKIYAFDFLLCPLLSAALAAMLTKSLLPDQGIGGVWQMALRIAFSIGAYGICWYTLSFCEKKYLQNPQRKPKKERFMHKNALL
ncbi:MAG: polysaccharide biosynthesis C-terminal domain-containing protein, partial [Clostridia bacterium]|nr:polysaccharide biosynthesis C-terminal domain-containing protein [Clostridia bacterium]